MPKLILAVAGLAILAAFGAYSAGGKLFGQAGAAAGGPTAVSATADAAPATVSQALNRVRDGIGTGFLSFTTRAVKGAISGMIQKKAAVPPADAAKALAIALPPSGSAAAASAAVSAMGAVTSLAVTSDATTDQTGVNAPAGGGTIATSDVKAVGETTVSVWRSIWDFINPLFRSFWQALSGVWSGTGITVKISADATQ